MTFSIQGGTKQKARELKRRRDSVTTLKTLQAAALVQGGKLNEQQAAAATFALREQAETSRILTIEPYLRMFLTLDGQPYSLDKHAPFGPLFGTRIPYKCLLIAGRQVGKSQSIMASALMRSSWIKNFRQLVLCPLYEQVRRLSSLVAKPFVENSPVRSLWTSPQTQQSVLQYTFRNQSRMLFSFALLDASRVRGIAADSLAIDEIQDFEIDHMDVVNEVISASKWAISQYSGTALTRDSTIERLWSKSSQAEWFIPCEACGHWNIPCTQYDLINMIGPWHDKISENCPGLVCARCRRPVRPQDGRWKHRYEAKRWTFAGYHIPQPIMPLHYASPRKWAELLQKMSPGNMAPHSLHNEVFGESYDVGSKLLTETDIRRAACLSWDNEPWESRPERQIEQRKRYKHTVLAVDWGGGGEKEESYTALALLGMTANGRIHTIWGKRLMTPNDHIREANEIRHWLKVFKPGLFAHDSTGAGAIRETLLKQMNVIDLKNVMPIEYVGPMHGLLKMVPPTPDNPRRIWRLNKTRSLSNMVTAIRTGFIQTFKYDYVDEARPGLLSDMLALVQAKIEGVAGGDLYRIRKSAGATDDFAQAINMGSTALWHRTGQWPDFADNAVNHPDSNVTEAMLKYVGSVDHNWTEEVSFTH